MMYARDHIGEVHHCDWAMISLLFFVTGMSLEDSTLNISQHDIVYKVLLGDRDNINIVHEIFRQVMLLQY